MYLQFYFYVARSSVRQRRSLKDSIELTSVEELLDEINNNYDPGMLLD
jgi:hypothetical protein